MPFSVFAETNPAQEDTPESTEQSVGTGVQLETVIVEGQRLLPTISRKEMRGSELVQIPSSLSMLSLR